MQALFCKKNAKEMFYVNSGNCAKCQCKRCRFATFLKEKNQILSILVCDYNFLVRYKNECFFSYFMFNCLCWQNY